MSCVCWDWERIIYYEFLGRNQTVKVEFYVQQIERLNTVIQEKTPNLRYAVLLLHDNVPPYIDDVIKETIQMHGREMLLHPSYSLDLASTDVRLFRSLSKIMRSFAQY